MWPTLFITLAIILVIAIPLAIIWRRESAAERMRIDKIASSHTCPVCNGDVIWNGGTWGIDANPPEFSDAGVVLECIECNKQLHLNDRNEIVENALSDYASSNA